jgi:hypothetical protein
MHRVSKVWHARCTYGKWKEAETELRIAIREVFARALNCDTRRVRSSLAEPRMLTYLCVCSCPCMGVAHYLLCVAAALCVDRK